MAHQRSCDAIKDPFYIQGETATDTSAGNQFKFTNLLQDESNLEPDELALYILIILLSIVQFTMIVRYFFRLQGYFDRLQKEIHKQVEVQAQAYREKLETQVSEDVIVKRTGSIAQSSPKPRLQPSKELKIGDTMKLDKSNISKNEKSATALEQSDFMKKSYIKLERRNTRYKM